MLMLAMEPFGGPIGPRDGVEGRRTEGGLLSGRRKPDDATDPTSFTLPCCVRLGSQSRWLVTREDISAETYISVTATMRGVALACVLSSASAFLGGSPALKVRHAKSSPQIAAQAPPARSVALQMSSALAEESGVSLSSGGGMFTSSSPEDRRIGTELCVVRRPIYCARAHTRLARGDRAVSAARAHQLHNHLPRKPPLSWRARKISNSTQNC